jgi:hypothetical protein
MDRGATGRLFRTAWVEAVRRYYPGTPKDGYVAPWEEMPDWERKSAQAVAEQIAHFVAVSDGRTARLSPAQRGQFVATCWIAQIHRHFQEPKPSYVASWEELSEWQRETDTHIFDVIERAVQDGTIAASADQAE